MVGPFIFFDNMGPAQFERVALTIVDVHAEFSQDSHLDVPSEHKERAVHVVHRELAVCDTKVETGFIPLPCT